METINRKEVGKRIGINKASLVKLFKKLGRLKNKNFKTNTDKFNIRMVIKDIGLLNEKIRFLNNIYSRMKK